MRKSSAKMLPGAREVGGTEPGYITYAKDVVDAGPARVRQVASQSRYAASWRQSLPSLLTASGFEPSERFAGRDVERAKEAPGNDAGAAKASDAVNRDRRIAACGELAYQILGGVERWHRDVADRAVKELDAAGGRRRRSAIFHCTSSCDSTRQAIVRMASRATKSRSTSRSRSQRCPSRDAPHFPGANVSPTRHPAGISSQAIRSGWESEVRAST